MTTDSCTLFQALGMRSRSDVSSSDSARSISGADSGGGSGGGASTVHHLGTLRVGVGMR